MIRPALLNVGSMGNPHLQNLIRLLCSSLISKWQQFKVILNSTDRLPLSTIQYQCATTASYRSSANIGSAYVKEEGTGGCHLQLNTELYSPAVM